MNMHNSISKQRKHTDILITVCTEHIPSKDRLLPCPEHPHLHHAQRDIGKSHDYPAELRDVMELNCSERKD